VTAGAGPVRVPASIVVVLALVVAGSGSVTLWQRGASPAAPDPVLAAGSPTAAPPERTVPAAPVAPPVRDGSGERAAGLAGAPEEPAPVPAPVEEDPQADARAVEAEPSPDAGPEPGPADEAPAVRPDVPGRTSRSPLPPLDLDELAATADRTGIPGRALAAYASAALLLREEQPSCRITWVTLAGVGYVESHHGTIGGRQLRDDGHPSSPIVGVALDGGPGVRAIPDTDGGRYDGDARWDRAVGPMQFIPSTWARWGADGNGDGTADPQHVDDAALAAARYLCASGGDLTAASPWGQAVLSYNRSEDYVRHVLSVANGYADRANAG
jgi:hypothetical protein